MIRLRNDAPDELNDDTGATRPFCVDYAILGQAGFWRRPCLSAGLVYRIYTTRGMTESSYVLLCRL